MDLALSADEAAFAAEARRWLAAALAADPPPPAADAAADTDTDADTDSDTASDADAAAELAWARRWQARLAADRWVGIHWPEAYGGRGASPVEVALFNVEYARAGAPQPVNRVGINLAGPTLLAHGTDEQRARWLPAILDASELWCQLFSEPDAGSDLASLRTVAERDESIPGWRLTGQKVWTSYAGVARWGICLARTDPEVQPRQAGISYLVVDMQQPGVEIRPLRQITGEAEFNEVFLDGVAVPDDHLVGPLHGGWAVAATTLAHERGTAFPFKEQVVHEQYVDDLWRDAHAAGRFDQADGVLVADRLAQAWLEVRLLRLHNWRTLTRLARGQDPGPESSLVKLAWTDATQHLSAAALDVLGPAAPVEGRWARQWLWSKAASIAGGTSEVQKTILADRLLGLPR